MSKTKRTRRQQYKKQFRNKTFRRQLGGARYPIPVDNINAYTINQKFEKEYHKKKKILQGKVIEKKSNAHFFNGTVQPGKIIVEGTITDLGKETISSTSAPTNMKHHIWTPTMIGIKVPMDLEYGVPIKNIDH